MQINRCSGMGFRSASMPGVAAKQSKVDGSTLSDSKLAAGKMDPLDHSAQGSQVVETQVPEK